MHNIYSYHAKFTPEIPRKFIRKYSNKNDLVLDPFCGCGTTLLEALKLKRNAIGVDLSPIGILCSKVKTCEYDLNIVKKYEKQILQVHKENILIPNFPDKNIWFNESVLNCLGMLNYNISAIKDEKYKNLFYLILLSILNSCSRKRQTWNLGYLADNVLPNKDRIVDPTKLYKQKITRFYKRSDILKKVQNNVMCIESDVLNVNNVENADLVVTSPPYPFAVDFIKYHRLALYWMEKSVDNLSYKEIGARNKRNRKNALNEFYQSMETVYKHIMNMVKINGIWCMTIGNTTRNKEKINFVDWTIKLFEKNGWVLEKKTFRYLKQQTMAQKRIKKESILIFKKVKNIKL